MLTNDLSQLRCCTGLQTCFTTISSGITPLTAAVHHQQLRFRLQNFLHEGLDPCGVDGPCGLTCYTLQFNHLRSAAKNYHQARYDSIERKTNTNVHRLVPTKRKHTWTPIIAGRLRPTFSVSRLAKTIGIFALQDLVLWYSHTLTYQKNTLQRQLALRMLIYATSGYTCRMSMGHMYMLT